MLALQTVKSFLRDSRCRCIQPDVVRRCLLLTLFGVGFLATAQEPLCDASLIMSSGTPYGYRERGDRCEGLYVSEAAGTTLQVASLTQSFEHYDLSVRDLQVTWRSPRNMKVYLRANGLQPKLYYRMDTVQSPGKTSYTWPAAILAGLRISREDLGVMGWIMQDIGGTESRVYLPLRIGNQPSPARSDSYSVVLVPGRPLSRVYVDLFPVKDDGHTGGSVLKQGLVHEYPYAARWPVSISIPIPQVPGLYLLHFGADLVGGGVTTTQLFLHAVF